jgi:AraC-like DNA-binding protein
MIPADADFPIHRISSDDVPEHDRLAFVRAAYGRTIIDHDIEPHADSPFYWRGVLRKLPGLGLATTVASGVRTVRPRAPIDGDDLVVNVTLEGRLIVRQLGRETVVGPGEIAVTRCLDTASCDCDPDSRWINLRVPATALGPMIADLAAALASTISAPEPLSMLLKYVDVLLDSNGLERRETLNLAVAHVHEIVALILGANRAAAGAEKVGPGAVRLRAIKADIVENACARELSIAAVAARHRVTPRYVRKLFECDGTTFSEFVLGQRLAHAHAMLTDPRCATDTISTIAFACGFGDLSYFNRVFRRRNGTTPTAVRASAPRRAVAQPGG